MVAEVSSMAGTFSGIAGSAIGFIIKIIVGILGIGIVGAVIFYWKRKQQYNIPVTVWIPRSDGKIMDEIKGKGGYFKTKQDDGGTITSFRLKRKGAGTVDIPPPASKFLVGLNRHLYLIQKGVDDFEPVLPESFRYAETEKGNRVAITNLKCINQDATAWVEDNRENAKKRFTLHGFWEKYKDWIQITIFIFIVMLSIYINWIGMQDVVEGLKQVAKLLGNAAGGSVSVS